MKKVVIVEKDLLVDGLDKVGVLKEGKLLQHQGFQLEVNNGELKLVKLDGINLVKHKMLATGDDMVASIQNYKQVFKALKLIKSDNIKIVYDTENKNIKLTDDTKSMEFSDQGVKLSNHSFEPITIDSYNTDDLLDRINEVDYALSKDDYRPLLQGIHFNNADMVALDGYRLALSRDKQLDISNEFTINYKSINALKKMLRKHKDQPINIQVGKNTVRFSLNDNKTSIECKKVDGEYFNYSKIIRENHSGGVRIKTDELKNNIKYLATLSESTGKTKQEAEGNIAVIKPLSSDIIEVEYDTGFGIYKVKINVTENTINHRIGLNVHYLLDAVNKIDGKEVYLGLQGEYNPLILEGKNLNSIHLVLPIRLNK